MDERLKLEEELGRTAVILAVNKQLIALGIFKT